MGRHTLPEAVVSGVLQTQPAEGGLAALDAEMETFSIFFARYYPAGCLHDVLNVVYFPALVNWKFAVN